MAVDPMVIAAGLSAASNLAGKLIGGGGGGSGGNMRNMREANEAALKGKVKAAEKMGISKLYALGAPTVSPVMDVGGSGPSLGETISSMGADVSRAVAAGQTSVEKEVQRLLLEKAKLENQLLGAQINKINSENAKVTTIPDPTIPGREMVVSHPDLGQMGEQHYGEAGDLFFGVPALLTDQERDVNKWAVDKFGIDPREWNPWAWGSAAGSWVRSQFRPRSYSRPNPGRR